MEYNNDFRYDLKVGKVYEHKLAALLGNKIEVKRDFKCLDTGNIFVEYESRGKKSGISITEAEYWCYWLSDYHFFMVETERLKTICRNYLNTRRDTIGGDSNTSKGILVPLKIFFENKY
jgi:hypothetical protein